MASHALQESRDTRAHQDIDLADLALNFYGQHDVSVFDWLELRVHESLVEVKHECLAAKVTFALGTDQPLGVSTWGWRLGCCPLLLLGSRAWLTSLWNLANDLAEGRVRLSRCIFSLLLGCIPGLFPLLTLLGLGLRLLSFGCFLFLDEQLFLESFLLL